MKLYRYTCGMDEKYGPAESAEDAYDRREQVDPMFHVLPVVIDEVTIPGYEIVLQPVFVGDGVTDNTGALQAAIDRVTDFDTMDADQLRAWLDRRGIKYHSQYGERKLRDLCIEKSKEEAA